MPESGLIAKPIRYGGQSITLHGSSYPNGRQAIYGMCDDGERWDMLSVNLPEVELGKGEFLVPVDGQPDSWVEACRKSGAFLDTGKRITDTELKAMGLEELVGLEVWKLRALDG